MNFAATASPTNVASKSPAVQRSPAPAAGDTYISVLVRLLDIGEQLKIQSVAIEHARNCAAKRDWPGVQISLAVLCCAAGDIRKIAAAANEKIGPEMDDCVNVYGENR